MTTSEIIAFNRKLRREEWLTYEEALNYMASEQHFSYGTDHYRLFCKRIRQIDWKVAEGTRPLVQNSNDYNNMLAYLKSWNIEPFHDCAKAVYQFKDISPSKINNCALKGMLDQFMEDATKGAVHTIDQVSNVLNLIFARRSDVRRLISCEDRSILLALIIQRLNAHNQSIPTWLLGDFLRAVKLLISIKNFKDSEVRNKYINDINYFLYNLKLPITLTRIKLFFSGYIIEAFSPYLSSAPVKATANAWGNNGEPAPEEDKLSIWSRIKNFFASLFSRKGNQDKRGCGVIAPLASDTFNTLGERPQLIGPGEGGLVRLEDRRYPAI